MQEETIRILLVEDDEDEVLLVAEAIGDAGATDISLDHADRLETALSKLANETFDAVLLDLSLPDTSGIQGVAPVVEAAGKAPVIVCTGLSDERVGQDAIRAGAQDYLIKTPELYRAIPRILRYAVERNRLLLAKLDDGKPGKRKDGRDGKGRIYTLWTALGAFVVTALLLVSHYAWQDYRRGMAQAEDETRHALAFLSDRLGRSFAEVMLLLDTVDQELGFAQRLSVPVPEESLQQMLEETSSRFSQIEAVAVLTAEGEPVLEAGRWEHMAQSMNLSSLFHQMRSQSDAGVAVTPPFKHGADGAWRIALVQPRFGPRERFNGAIVAVLDPAHFRNSLVSGPARHHVGLTFLQAGSAVLAMEAAANPRPALPAADGRIFAKDLMLGRTGTFEAGLAGSTDPWIVSYRRLPTGGVIVGAGILKQSVIDAWLHRRIPDALIGGTPLIVIIALFVYTILQIQHRLRAESAAEKAETYLTDGMESLSEGFVLFDSDDRLSLCNSRLGEIYPDVADILHKGAQRSELLRAAVKRGMYAGIRATGSERWLEARIREPRPLHSHSEHQLTSGRWVQVSESRIRDGGTIALHVDITDRKRREVALEAAKVAAEQASKAKSEFLAMISHELRTPLNAIVGFSDLMKIEAFGPLGDEKYKDYVTDINASGAHLSQVINDILDLSKAEAGKLQLREEILDVHETIATSVRIVRQMAGEVGVTLEQAKQYEGTALLGDARALKQILFNLLSNAIKFSPDGGHVAIRLTLDGSGDLCLSVADEGIGIAAEDIPRVLAPFQQVDSELSRQFEGTGLGLPLVKHLAEMHGGALEIQSTLGVGTTVSVRFPADRVNPSSAAA
ncbi:MAG: ATP-binding protein [Alphaproteobacteria bacterium]|nr:ATP-binding protein [Alphaproteobacteria bacterium]